MWFNFGFDGWVWIAGYCICKSCKFGPPVWTMWVFCFASSYLSTHTSTMELRLVNTCSRHKSRCVTYVVWNGFAWMCADTSFVAPLVYAFMGSSRDIAIGPVAVVSLLLGRMLSNEITDYKSHEYLRLAFTATFFAGITQMVLGVFRFVNSKTHSPIQIC